MNELLNKIVGKLNASVKTDAQSLTDAQKAQARVNIGAASQQEVIQLSEEIAAIGTQEDIVQQVIAALGTPVYGRVDADKNIYLTGVLAGGTYTLWWEDENGKVSELCTITKEQSVELGWVPGQPSRESSTQIVYYGAVGSENNYKMVYQTAGNVPLYTSPALVTPTPYYPLIVPDGKSTMKLTFPNLGSNKLIMAVRALELDGSAFKQTASSGWLTEGVYEWSFDAGVKYLAPYFRNSSYGDLGNYDISGVTVSWE